MGAQQAGVLGVVVQFVKEFQMGGFGGLLIHRIKLR
jgi:hypothetical protein